MCENAVRKYIRQLEDRGMVYTEPTEVITRSNGKRKAICCSPSGQSRR